MAVKGIVTDLYCEFTVTNRSDMRLRVDDVHSEHGSWSWDDGGNRVIWPGESKHYTAKDPDWAAYGSEGTVRFRDDAGATFTIRYCCSYGKGGNYGVVSQASPLLDVTLRFANTRPPRNAGKDWGSATAPLNGHPLGILIYIESRNPKRSLKILTYNTHLFKGSNAAAAQPSLVQMDDERASEILRKVVETGADIVCLEEVWSLNFQHEVTRRFAQEYPYFYIAPDNTVKTQWWEDWLNWVLPVLLMGVTGGWSIYYMIGNIVAAGQGYNSLSEMLRNSLSNTSGLLLASRFPLNNVEFTMYEGLHGDDQLAKKGVIAFTALVAAERDIPLSLRVGMTHCPTDIGDALRVIETVAAPKAMQDDHLDRILLGDFNLHRTNDSEYSRLNGVVMGASDITEKYLPKMADSYTDWQFGNSLTWLIDRQREPRAPSAGQDRIDYVYFAPRTGGSPFLRSTKVSVFHDWELDYEFNAFGKTFEKLTLSDHYPVLAEFEIVSRGTDPFKDFKMHAATALSLGEVEAGSYALAVAPADGDQGICDLYCIKQKNSPSNKIELHIANAKTAYSSWKSEVLTPLSDPRGFIAYLIGDYLSRNVKDLYCLKAAENTKRLEIHVVNGASRYSDFLFQRTTPIALAGLENFDFVLGNFDGGGRPDLFCIKRRGTDTNQVEIHVLSGADQYQSFLYQSALPLSVAEAEAGKYQFAAARYRRPAGNADLLLLKRANTASGKMEASVLDGTNHFATYLLQDRATALTAADSLNFEFRAGNLSGVGGTNDYDYRTNAALYCLKRRNTGSGRLEVHVLV